MKKLFLILFLSIPLIKCNGSKESSIIDSNKTYIKKQFHKNGALSLREYYINDTLSGWTSEYDSNGTLMYQSKYVNLGNKYQSNEYLNFKIDGSISLEKSLFFSYPNLMNNMIFNGDQVHVCVSNPEFDSTHIIYEIYSSNKIIYSDSACFDNSCFYFKTNSLKPGFYLIKGTVDLINKHYKEIYEKEKGITLNKSATVLKKMRKEINKKIQILSDKSSFRISSEL